MTGSLDFPAKGVDYAFQHPNVAGLVDHGVRFVGRYVAGGSPKQLTGAEAAQLHDAGLHIALFFELGADEAQAGAHRGKVDAEQAAKACAELRIPSGIVVYFAVDYELTARLAPATRAYLQAAKLELGKHGRHAGAYGGFNTMALARDAGIPYGCQTLAWSGGRWDQAATFWQTSIGQELAGAPVDYLKALRSFGGWAP